MSKRDLSPRENTMIVLMENLASILTQLFTSEYKEAIVAMDNGGVFGRSVR